jgi:hypothetical protein
MTNTDSATSEKTGRKVADHILLDAEGNEVKTWEKGTGIKYRVAKTGEEFKFQIPGAVPGSIQTMLALFGSRTLAVNTASQNRQDATSDATDPVAIAERFSLIKDGDWGAERGGGGGIRIDIDTLVEALGRTLRKEKKIKDWTPELSEKYKAKVTDDEAYRKNAFGNPAVKAAYYAVQAEKGGGSDALVLE